MANVYIEPQPSGSDTPITHYTIENEGGRSVDGVKHSTQAAAIAAAKRLGHQPLVAHVRKTNKGRPDHWRHA